MLNIQVYLIIFIAVNRFIFSNAGYIRTPASDADLTAVLKQSFELKCEYTNGDGQFLDWYRDDLPASNEKPGHYIVTSTNNESKLIIKIFAMEDSEIKKWSVKTNKRGNEEPVQCRFGSISLIPSLQSIETDRSNEKFDFSHGSVRRIQDESVKFQCNIEPNQTQYRTNQIQWEFSTDNLTFTKLPVGVQIVSEDQIFIDKINKKAHRGYYRCSLNNISFTVSLRVKVDQLAALWPFIGIVSVVLVLVLIILIYEKRQRLIRKAATTDDDDNDHANDPLVRSTNKSSDNETKNQAIKT